MNQQIRAKFISLLKDASFLIGTDAFPIFRKKDEPDPADIPFIYQKKSKSVLKQNPSAKILFKEQLTREERNISCKLCSDRLSGIRSFKRNGRKNILVLHYSGETKKGKKPFVKKSKHQIFRTKEAEDIFGKLIQKVFGFSYLEFFYQEYPACNFQTDNSSVSDWIARADKCRFHVNESLASDNIAGIIMLGSSAVVAMGIENAKKNEGQIINYDHNGKNIPQLILRSPEAILQMQEKRKQLSVESIEYGNLQMEENSLIEKFSENLRKFKTKLGL